MAGGGARRLSEAVRAAVAIRLAAGRAAGIAKRIAVKEAGMIWAKAWRAEHHPVATREHMPFAGHRTVAEVDAGLRWCTECKQLRSEPCRYALCALAEAAR